MWDTLSHVRGTIAAIAGVDAASTRIAVTNDGPGFPTDFAPNVSDRFTPVEANRSAPGTGLELPWCKP